MRARLNSLLLAAVWLLGAGCALKPVEESPRTSLDSACASAAGNSLHLTSTSAPQATERDAATDSVLTQPASDPRLAQINARLYLSLRSLDAELQREQMLAACAQQSFANSALPPAQAGNQSGGVASDGAASGTTATPTSVPVASSAVAGIGNTRALRKTTLSSGDGGGSNGATAPKVVPGSDNDIVARRLRTAAQQETNPSLRAKLWREYIDYRQGTSGQ